MSHRSVAAILFLGVLFAGQHVSQAKIPRSPCASPNAANYERDKYLFVCTSVVFVYDPHTQAFEQIVPTDKWYKGIGHLVIDAVYHPSNDPSSTIVITGNEYFKYDSQGNPLEGPTSLVHILPYHHHWSEGVAAATLFHNYEFFFRGCETMVRSPFRPYDVGEFSNKEFELPCNIDAAYIYHDLLVVWKGTSLYVMKNAVHVLRNL